jgi:S1-C subfamily serine protease
MSKTNRRNFLQVALASSALAIGGLEVLTSCDINPSKRRFEGMSIPNQEYVNSYDNHNVFIEEGKAEKICESVELIKVESSYKELDFLGNNFISDQIYKRSWHGSGLVMHDDAMNQYILTAGHVAMPEKELDNYGRKYKLVDTNIFIRHKKIKLEFIAGELSDNLDYAYLKTPRNSKLKTMEAKIGNSDILQRGDFLYAYGYPYITGQTMTDGKVSCPYHLPPQDENAKKNNDEFMFTSAISPGNSGGPMFTTKNGELYLVGICVATYRGAQNLNIATKINAAFRHINNNV